MYIDHLRVTSNINSILDDKKIRNDPLPSHITENIVKFVYAHRYNIMPSWNTKTGDLVINKTGNIKQIEVKGFMSTGPSSFGPKEKWDILYFVDAQDIMNRNFKIYEVNLSNTSDKFKNIRISERETFWDIARSGRRPRSSFEKGRYPIKPQLGENCKLIFDGNISQLDNSI